MIDLEKFSVLTEGYLIGHTIKYAESTPSTMTLAKNYVDPASPYRSVDAGLPISGTVFVTEEQTAGRGRTGRNWETPYGKALLFSVIVQRPHLPQNPSKLAMIAGLAAAQAIEKLLAAPSAHIRLKWPNDLLLALRTDLSGNEPAKMGKVGGILIESVIQQGRLQSAIIGIGINANQTQDELPPVSFGAPKATSIRLYLKKASDRTELLAYLCEELSILLSMRDSEQGIHDAWRRRLDTLNQHVSLYERMPEPVHSAGTPTTETPTPIFSGRAVDVDTEGSLVIEDEFGERRSFHSGDVSVRY